ncbi:hypothetical protein ALI22I_23455 [Saccharothrix sp. ALI-22-I]|nr:hypothetical protein ALI22I_23455 [Saccharothrix sp. ALI-22-I]
MDSVRYDSQLNVELRLLDDDRLAMFAYSTLANLVRGCGELQPWAAITPADVDTLAVSASVDVVIWDAALPERLRHVREAQP